jgi:serine protease AprX
MKKYLLSIAVVAIISFAEGQSNDVNRLLKNNNELLEKALKTENEAEQRILVYLNANPQTKRNVLMDNGIEKSIFDIMDGKPVYIGTSNLNSAKATGVTDLQAGGSLGLNLDGSGMTVLVWDGGPVEVDHAEFIDAGNTLTRVTNIDEINVNGGVIVSSHATHVTGTISAKGIDQAAKGMAPNATIVTYNFNSANSEIVGALINPVTSTLLSNHSWGLIIQVDGELSVPASFIGAYTGNAVFDDNLHHNNPYHLKVIAAGNDGSFFYTDGLANGLDKLTGWSVAKNNLGVAWARPALGGNPFAPELTFTISPFSNEGPTDDLRVKPDIAADGELLYSTVPGGGYGLSSGTSMATPNTTGALVLLQQYYEQLNGVYMRSATAKGLVCHTAIDDDINVGPDPFLGWGFLNALEAANTITNSNAGTAVLEELTLNQGEEYTFSFSAMAGDKIKASICWTDLPGLEAGTTLNDQTPRLINDLDLRVLKDGVVYEPWRLELSDGSVSAAKGDNIRDNVEVVEIDNFETGEYTLTVSHKGLLRGNAGAPFSPQSQDFSLILTGSNIVLSTTDSALSQNLVIYPNPSKGEFTISFDSSLINNDEVKIDVYDLRGRLVYNNTFANKSVQFNKTINLGGVASGVYVANISKGGYVATHKIIVE